MKNWIILMSVLLFFSCAEVVNQEQDKAEIEIALHKSAEDWSAGNVEAFMEAYWKSDRLQFVGSQGITYGWDNTLKNYYKRYPTKDHMGKLNFEILDISFLATDLYLLTGKYHLERTVGNADGIFTVVFKKMNNKWLIIADHSA